MKRAIVFYAGLVHSDSFIKNFKELQPHALPDGCYIYFPGNANIPFERPWYLRDFTPVLLEDVPKELRTLVLLMS